MLAAASHFPTAHPLLPSLHVNLPAAHSASEPRPVRPPDRLSLAPVMQHGSWLTLHSRVPGAVGRVVTVESNWNHGGWHVAVIGRVTSSGAVRLAMKLPRRGGLQLRIDYPNGTTAVGRTRVQ